MIKSPLIDEWRAEAKQGMIREFLEARFGAFPPEIAVQLEAIKDENRLSELARAAALCSDLDGFRAKLDA